MQAFDLNRFLPFLLNQAAERVGGQFAPAYREGHGFSRTQWRILAHLGCFGAMTAAEVARRSHTEKSKVSRAVAGLEARALLSRTTPPLDRRTELLELTASGITTFELLSGDALAFDRRLRDRLGEQASERLTRVLQELADEQDQTTRPADLPG